MLCGFLRALVFSSLSTLAAAQEATGPVAIICTGSVDSIYKRKVDQYRRTRIYVLDETRRWVAYWNEEKQEQIPVCNAEWQSCTVKFGPREIEASGNLNKNFGFYMVIDRRSGSIIYSSSSFIESKWQFVGSCKTTEIPHAQKDWNKF